MASGPARNFRQGYGSLGTGQPRIDNLGSLEQPSGAQATALFDWARLFSPLCRWPRWGLANVAVS